MESAATTLGSLDLSKVILAIGGLGTAAYGVVDAMKVFDGGISNRGFGDIREIITKFIPPSPAGQKTASAHSLSSVLSTLRANWINGMPMSDQKSIAKALIKLNLTRENAEEMAAAAGVNADRLLAVAEKLVTAEPLKPEETDVYGRFDLLLSAQLDEGYQRGDQRYRNSAKALAVPVAVILALLGAWAVDGNAFNWRDAIKALAGGLLATPLAPVAKDVASTIQAGAKLAQFWKK
ncbi:MAG: hypothetical protein C5B58_13980 [Acidobacteria bacterium]|nr:MAG: hypothetical protein C5B58_13980 [Acidobacteriota bacterium]